jgi:hypothetical protein
MSTTNPSPGIDSPLTAEGRLQLLETAFSQELPHPGEIFVPSDNFYLSGISGKKQADHMLRELCRWLGIKPGYIGLEFEAGQTKPPDGKRHTIHIETTLLHDEFVLGAYLANSLTQYLVEQRKQIWLPDTDQQASLLASASVIFGLSAVVLNGYCRAYYTPRLLRSPAHVLLKGFDYNNYLLLTRNYLHKYRIEPVVYSHSLTPQIRRALGLPVPARVSHAIHDLKHRLKVRKLKILGLNWLLALVIAIAGFTLLQQAHPMSGQAREAEQKVTLLGELVKTCHESLAYSRNYVDYSDIQAMRALNAEELRCQSLQNQYDAANRGYKALNQ